MADGNADGSTTHRARYIPPWADTSIIGIAGSSGSGKTSLALAIVESLNLPWVVILSMDSFYKTLTSEESERAFRNDFDFDSPSAIDFDILVDKLRDIKEGKKADIPVYSFEKHSRLDKTTSIYSPHVLILEGIFALHDQRVLDMLDLKIFADADADLCLSRRLLRDVQHRGRDIEGCIKQWFAFVKPNFHRYVEPQRQIADIIIPRGIENKVAISMVRDRIRKLLAHKSTLHTASLHRLAHTCRTAPLPPNTTILPPTPQRRALTATLLDPATPREPFIFAFDRTATALVETATSNIPHLPHTITTPQGHSYEGCTPAGQVAAVVMLRGGSALETGLKRVLPDCLMGRILIRTSAGSGEPALHFCALPPDLGKCARVLLLDAQMRGGAAALMAVRVLVDHGVEEERIVVVAWGVGGQGLRRLGRVWPEVGIVVGRVVEEDEERWVERKYLGC
ncbi:MAG: Uridine kinase [Bathelium mastoideum]|nr:MAG: Uridine kinase [Bathelium mastoideum]